jgi:uncharacterized repeat protein (TIGR02543 family)
MVYIYLQDFARNRGAASLDFDDGTLSVYDDGSAPSDDWQSLQPLGVPEYGASETKDGATYRKVQGGYVLTSYKDSPTRTRLAVKDGPVRIAAEAFKNALSLTSIELPASLKAIGHGAFFGCGGLTEYTFKSIEAPALETPFGSATYGGYNHFNDYVSQNTLPLSLNIGYGSTGYDSRVWKQFFGDADTTASRTIRLVLGAGADDIIVVGSPYQPAKLPIPTRVGYRFTGWFTDAALTAPYTAGNYDDLTLYADWQIGLYTVSFVTGGGDAVHDISLKYGDALSLPKAAWQNREFLGWFTNEAGTEAFTLTVMPADNLVLYAKWGPLRHTVTFDTRGGAELFAAYVYDSNLIAAPDAPVRKGYRFTGWYTDETISIKYDFARPVTQNLTLYAGWEKLSGCSSCATTSFTGILPYVGIFTLLGAALLLTKRQKAKRA